MDRIATIFLDVKQSTRTMRESQVVLLGILLAAATSTGCIERLRFEIFNDTPKAITVITPDQQPCHISARTACKIWDAPTMAIVREQGDRWGYEVPPLGPDSRSVQKYVEAHGIFERVLRLKVTETGIVYVVRPGGDWSAILPAQPAGYPLRPMS